MLKKIYNLIVCCLFFTVGTISAQQPAQYSMYMLNPYHYHSAYGGLDESLSATGVFRKQWVNFPGSPLGFSFNAHLPIEYIKSGVGLSMEHDVIGAYSNTFVRASYNYIIDFGDNGKLSVGGAFRFMQKTLDGSLLRSPDGNYEGGIILSHNDNLIPQIKVSSSTVSADAGIYYKHRKFEAGLTALNLTSPKLTLDVGTIQQIRYVRNFILTGSYRWDINDKMSLHPSFLLKTDLIKFQPEIGAIFKYQDNFFGGLTFRGYSKNTKDAVVLIAGLKLNKNFILAYSYDISVSKLTTYNSGSHEVILNYNLNRAIGKEIPAKVIYNPRFL
jgi:type IX secretion system PorP/SprF family membrane protein